jgi:hypothetical protein
MSHYQATKTTIKWRALHAMGSRTFPSLNMQSSPFYSLVTGPMMAHLPAETCCQINVGSVTCWVLLKTGINIRSVLVSLRLVNWLLSQIFWRKLGRCLSRISNLHFENPEDLPVLPQLLQANVNVRYDAAAKFLMPSNVTWTYFVLLTSCLSKKLRNYLIN